MGNKDIETHYGMLGIQGENFNKNPVLQKFLSKKSGESKLILIKENVKHKLYGGESICKSMQESEWILATLDENLPLACYANPGVLKKGYTKAKGFKQIHDITNPSALV